MQASSSPSAAGEVTPTGGVFGWLKMDRDSLDQACERGILGLVLLILVFEPLAFGGVDTPQLLVLQALTLGVLFLWVFRVWLSKSYRVLWGPVCWGVALFLIYAVARYRMVLAENGIELLARQELILVLIYGVLFFAILNNLSRQESIQIVSITLLSLGTVLSLYALYQFLTKSGRVLWAPQFPIYVGRGSGTYICPNHLAGFLEMVLPLGLAYTLTGRFKPATKVFLGYASLAVFTGIGVSVSRGAWVSTALSLLVFFGLLIRKRGQRLAAIIFLALLLGAFVFFVKNLAVLQRRVGITRAETQVDTARLQLWKPTYQMWQDNFWWGVGPGHFDQRFRTYRPDDVQMRPLYAHNDYLNTLADWGLVGMSLIAGIMLLLYVGVFQSWKFVQRSNDLTTKRSNRSAFVLGAAASLVAVLAHSVVDFNMHIPANALVAITLMALITGHLRFASERFWVKLGWIAKALLTCLCVAAGCYFALEGFKRAREYVQLERAAQATQLALKVTASDASFAQKTTALQAAFLQKVAALQAAYAVEPKNFETTYELGETLRLASWQGVGNYRQLATDAILWFQKGVQLNRFDPYNYLRWGMCLHWLDRPEDAGPYFQKAIDLDPRNYYIQGLMGWHYFELGNWAESKRWFEKAVFQAHWHPDPKFKVYDTGNLYLRLIQQKLDGK